MSSYLKDNKELMREYDFEKNININLDAVTLGSEEKIWWLCSKGHSYQAMVHNRKKGSGCPYCDGKKVLVGYNDLATINPKLAAEWNYKKNGDLKPTDVTAGSHKKVWWICKNGHEWEAVINTRTQRILQVSFM